MLDSRIFSLNCAGGGSRFPIQLGYLKAIKDRGLEPDMVFGASVGALLACFFIQGHLAQAEDLVYNIENEDVYRTNWLNLPRILWDKNSIYDSSPLKELLDRYVDHEKLVKSKIDFYISVTNLIGSSTEIYSPKDVDEATFKKLLLASASPPLAFPPVEVWPGKFYGDGGLLSNFNLHLAVKKGAQDIILVSPTTKEKSSIKNAGKMFEILTSVPEYGYLERELSFIEKINQVEANFPDLRKIRCLVIKPEQPTGIGLLDFTFARKDRVNLINDAYVYAKGKIENFLLT
mgnify:CR=1 FL=1